MHEPLQDQERVERVVEALIAVVKSNPAKTLVEFSERSSCFKVKMSDPGSTIIMSLQAQGLFTRIISGSFPASLALDLKKCKSSSTTFGGRTQRV